MIDEKVIEKIVQKKSLKRNEKERSGMCSEKIN
jgi:hypothetical protein